MKLLERPVLYLSDYFLNNRQAYYDALNQYHSETGDISIWVDFFLDGVAIIAEQAISTSRSINILREKDIAKIQSIGRRANNGMVVLQNLFRVPIVNVRKIVEWTGLSYPTADELLKQLVDIEILTQRNKNAKYRREFWYKDYLDLFINKEEEKQD